MSPTSPTLAPEWAPQLSIWTAWPANADEWGGDLDAPRADVAALVRTLASKNRVRLLVHGDEAQQTATKSVGAYAEIIPATYGDIWLRDTGPIFAEDAKGSVALCFRTNGWGGKFTLPGDETVGAEIAALAATRPRSHGFVLEGGAIDHDGAGTFLATRQTLLNPNRNGWTEREAEAALREALGARKIIWLDKGITGDHTDGHVDNAARFVGPQRIVCQKAWGPDDPNTDVFSAILRSLEGETDADGHPIEVVRIPSPGRVSNALGEIAPASHLNFVIANGVVAVPIFDTPSQDEALRRLQCVFPDRTVVGLPALGLLGAGDTGGGAFHCITREEPAGARRRHLPQKSRSCG